MVLKIGGIARLWTNITSQPREALPLTFKKVLPTGNSFSLAASASFACFSPPRWTEPFSFCTVFLPVTLEVLHRPSIVFRILNCSQIAKKQTKRFLQLQTLSQLAGRMPDLGLWRVNNSSSLQYFHCYRQERIMQETSGYLISVFSVSHWQALREFNTAVPQSLSYEPGFSTLGTRSFWLHSDFLCFHSLYHLWAVFSQVSPNSYNKLKIKLTYIK